MPPKKRGRASRARRQPARPPSGHASAVVEEEPPSVELNPVGAAVAPAAPARPAPRPASRTPTGRASTAGAATSRIRGSRSAAQIVIANYDYLRHDLSILGVLAVSLVVILIVLSFVVH